MRRLIGTRLDYRREPTTDDRGPGPPARGGRGVRGRRDGLVPRPARPLGPAVRVAAAI